MRRAALALVLFSVVATAGTALPAAHAECPYSFPLRNGGSVAYCATFELGGTPQPAIRRAVLVVHGNSRGAAGAFSSVTQASRDAGVRAETLVIAPYFQPRSAEARAAGQLAWGDGWKEGDRSTDENSPLLPRRHSFEVADLFLSSLGSRTTYPNLREVVVAGHSAGGQFSQRYAATSQAEQTLSGIRVRYVVSNPSSYMYLNGKRWKDGAFRGLDEIQRLKCRGWDDYKYGLDRRSGYVGRLSGSEVRAQYRQRLVTYLLGELDTERDGDLDKGCEADWQGKHRLRRGELYFRHMNDFYAPHRHTLVKVPNVGHTAGGMYTSAVGRGVLFGPLPTSRRR